MIDYEKLKLAHDLAEENNIAIQYNLPNERLVTDNIDDLLSLIQQLTEPKPKYKVGDKVWFQYCGEIENKIVDEESLSWVNIVTGLYPNRKDLIEAQIDYWTSLKKEEKSTCSGHVSMNTPFEGETKACHHEPSRKHNIFTDDGGVFAMKECKKCGEFYK